MGVGKGTSAHNLLVATLEKAGLAFSDITPVYLSPADAAAAFASDQIDAWAVWDPFFAIAETRFKPDRAVFGIFPITEKTVANQQATADRFFRLGLIPRAITVTEAVWTPPASN